MKATVLVLVLCLLSVLAALAATHCEVAVVGGGSAGANMAVFLKKKGYNVCLFEQTGLLGGHCNTFTFPAPPGFPNWIDLGVQVYGNTTWFNEHGLGTWTLDSSAHLQEFLPPGTLIPIDYTTDTSTPYAVDLKHGLGPFDTTLTPEQQLAIAEALGTLFGILEQYPWLESAYYPDPIPSELLVPFSQWITTNGLQALQNNIFADFVIDSGLGSYDQVLALYALEGLHLGNLVLLEPTQAGLAVIGGCGLFYQGVTEYLGSSVYLNSNFLFATRPPHGVSTLHVLVNGDRQVFTTESIVLAMPQTLDNLAPFYPDAVELAAFSNLQTRDYFAMEFDIAGPAASTAFHLQNLDVTQPDQMPVLPSLVTMQRILPYGPCAGWSVSNTYISNSSMVDTVNAELANMPASVMTSVAMTKILHHVYQPYFPESALASSPTPYTKIAQLQGYRNTYYVGSAVSFAESIKVWQHAKDIADEFF